MPEARLVPVTHHNYSAPNSTLKYMWKFMQSITQSSLLFVTDATWITNEGQYKAVALILTTDVLIIVNTDEDVSQRVISLSELSGAQNSADPTLLSFKIEPSVVPPKLQDEVIEMDPACRARVVDYVRNTAGFIQFSEELGSDHSEMSVSPCPSPSSSLDIKEQQVLTFYVNPQSRNYFLILLFLAQQQHQNYSFPVL